MDNGTKTALKYLSYFVLAFAFFYIAWQHGRYVGQKEVNCMQQRTEATKCITVKGCLEIYDNPYAQEQTAQF